jgi:hypothetical protein
MEEMSNPFVYADSVSFTKTDIMDTPSAETGYLPFMVNKAMSYHPDAIFAANLMNMNGHLDKKLQYHYLLNTLSKKKRFAKWVKPVASLDLEAVMEYFGYGIHKAENAMMILKPDDIAMIHSRLEKGGTKNEQRKSNSGTNRDPS